jgi:hypothetical protein
MKPGINLCGQKLRVFSDFYCWSSLQYDGSAPSDRRLDCKPGKTKNDSLHSRAELYLHNRSFVKIKVSKPHREFEWDQEHQWMTGGTGILPTHAQCGFVTALRILSPFRHCSPVSGFGTTGERVGPWTCRIWIDWVPSHRRSARDATPRCTGGPSILVVLVSSDSDRLLLAEEWLQQRRARQLNTDKRPKASKNRAPVPFPG